uniref:ATPase subunit 8 n=1 Tax=Microcosmus sulcatus TaxID=341086 RepID=D2YVH0_9ASCI|nr:ATP synthase F0 subunit 8 [Microcosmus sulcatus]CAL23093.2 ATPase subunit 8 [Microcosmus sulcatus]
MPQLNFISFSFIILVSLFVGFMMMQSIMKDMKGGW